MDPARFAVDLTYAMVCYLAFVIGGVALVGGIAELAFRWKEWRERNQK
jgi:hypothetical protein